MNIVHQKILDDIEARNLSLKVKDFLIACIKKDNLNTGNIEQGLCALNEICNMYYNEKNKGFKLDYCFAMLENFILKIHPALIKWTSPIRKYVETGKGCDECEACDECENDYKYLINNVIFFSIAALERRNR